MGKDPAEIRKEYIREVLSESMVKPDPLQQFGLWWEEAMQSGIEEVNAMTLATSSLNGKPSVRTVLLKGLDPRGFIFFTNYQSRKGKEITDNPQVSLLFFWKELERQVRVEGLASRVDGTESDEYFQIRPRGSQMGAWASPQSRAIKDRDELEMRVREIENQFGDKTIPRPEFWGGFLVVPNQMEFWQGRSNRLHDRIQYTRIKESGWKIERLAP